MMVILMITGCVALFLYYGLAFLEMNLEVGGGRLALVERAIVVVLFVGAAAFAVASVVGFMTVGLKALPFVALVMAVYMGFRLSHWM